MNNGVVLLAAAVIALGLGVFWFGRRKRDDDAEDWDAVDYNGTRVIEPGRPQPRRRPFGTETVPVNVDPIRCARFGFCEHEAPDVFQLRREGRFTYKSSVPVDQIEPVIRAVEICPARAIRVGKLHSWSRNSR